MKLNKNILFVFLILFVSVYSINAQEDCFPKKQNRLVIDETGVLSASQQNQLLYKLTDFENRTSTQILVLIVNDLCGYDPAMYATELGHKWGVGQKGIDNGVVVLVKPTGGQGQKKVHIAIGYGLEDVIPDAIAKRIVENEMIPQFKNGDIYGGIEAGTNVVMQIAEGKYSAGEYASKSSNKGTGALPMLLVFLIYALFYMFSRAGRARSYARTNNVSFWMALFLLSSTRSTHSGHYGSFSSGGGSFGGFGGGGSFGGFGGGGFGGGGAGGSW